MFDKTNDTDQQARIRRLIMGSLPVGLTGGGAPAPAPAPITGGSYIVNTVLPVVAGVNVFVHPYGDPNERTFTIPSTTFPWFVAFIVNQTGTGVLKINTELSVMMRLAGSSDYGVRSLAANSVACVLKVSASELIITGLGSGLT